MDQKRYSPAVARNKGLILAELKKSLPDAGLILEVGSGGGEHIAYFAEHLPHLTFQPTDRNADYFPSITAWCADLGNVQNPEILDLLDNTTPSLGQADGLICINVLHIAPEAGVNGLFQHAVKLLRKDAPLYLYGPYFREGVETAASNLAFHEKLLRENPGGGIRQLEEVTRIAEHHGFAGPTLTEMPANNLSLVFKKG